LSVNNKSIVGCRYRRVWLIPDTRIARPTAAMACPLTSHLRHRRIRDMSALSGKVGSLSAITADRAVAIDDAGQGKTDIPVI
jgi:hypothetical protein